MLIYKLYNNFFRVLVNLGAPRQQNLVLKEKTNPVPGGLLPVNV